MEFFSEVIAHGRDQGCRDRRTAPVLLRDQNGGKGIAQYIKVACHQRKQVAGFGNGSCHCTQWRPFSSSPWQRGYRWKAGRDI